MTTTVDSAKLLRRFFPGDCSGGSGAGPVLLRPERFPGQIYVKQGRCRRLRGENFDVVLCHDRAPNSPRLKLHMAYASDVLYFKPIFDV